MPKPLPRSKALNRTQVAARLHCSVMQVRRFEQAGKLHTRIEPDEYGNKRVWFDPKEVETVSRSWEPKRASSKRKTDSKLVESNVRGKVAAKCFRLFRDGAGLHEAVIETEADPILVRQIYEEFLLSLEAGRERARQKDDELRDAAVQREHMRDRRAAERREHELKIERMRVQAAERVERVRGR